MANAKTKLVTTEEKMLEIRLARKKLDQAMRDIQQIIKTTESPALRKELRKTVGTCWQKISSMDDMPEDDAP